MNETRIDPPPLSNPSLNKAISVSELNRQAKRLLEVSMGQLWVTGEISSLSRPSSGHWYFSLKDEKAQVRCAMFKGYNQRLKFRPKEGDQVILRAKVSLYEGRGDYQLIVEGMEPAGLGQLQAAFEALKLKLSQEGLFDPKYKKPIPEMPKKAVVITSSTGAVIHDIISVTKRRFPSLEIRLIPVIVQGEGAAKEIANAIKLANEHHLGDVLIVGRGGGSLEDLWAFNEEPVARAIFESDLPIVSAVGHEVDFSIADMVADYRAPTPSAAAEKITPDQYELMQFLDQQQRRLLFLASQQLKSQSVQLENLRARLKHPGEYLLEKQQRLKDIQSRLAQAIRYLLDSYKNAVKHKADTLQANSPQVLLTLKKSNTEALQERLLHAMQGILDNKQHQMALAAKTLHTASPLSTLNRGYSITQRSNKEVITDASDVKKGERITTTLNNGVVVSRVEEIKQPSMSLFPEEN